MTGSPNRNRQAERREATRREVVETAWDIARAEGLACVTLREIADRIGMRPPSLYTHFESKNAVFDAMFADAYQQLYEEFAAFDLTGSPRAVLDQIATVFFDFATADIARYQLMFQRTLPGFTPSASAYEVSRRLYDLLENAMRTAGVTDPDDLDLWTAIHAGLTSQQLANDPGGDRWRRQLVRVVDMFCDAAQVPDTFPDRST
ncbi:TetR/AcrR family transcriptional regulator [Gordonia sp. ABSL1-1]|uniref:TetR/AcrR family transcriptional regulator n=1 Tax=Gordonia sp. ABSL1-1 TaxID=3053923 RepID=UPI002572439A|nr:TetR/AcrR family transcriptional regulator [Gordonia sp. ABSL1-1]MDL9937203.1 TetR/AcrR family transcriptional regulator [Gordonia sp. ABSL1-1]